MPDKKKKKKILVVDDYPKVLALIVDDLKLRGFEVLTADSGEQSLELINSTSLDIVLLDILMPEMDGFEVLNQLRGFTDIPVIAFSASPENRGPALQAGANQFLNKPFDTDEMAKEIEELLK